MWFVRARQMRATLRIRAARGNATFSVSVLRDAGSFRRDGSSFKQRKERSPLQARLFSSNAIPYASVTHPRCRRRLSLRCLSLSLFVHPRTLHLSRVPSPSSATLPAILRLFLATHPSCRYFPIDWSARRHPSRRSVRASPLSLFSFYSILSLYDGPTRLPLSPATSLLLFLHFPSEASSSSCSFLIRRGSPKHSIPFLGLN